MTTTAKNPPKERYYIHNQKMTDVMMDLTLRETKVFMVLCQYALSPGYPNAGLVSNHGRRLTNKFISKLTGINANHIYGVLKNLAEKGKIEIKDDDIWIENWEELQPKPKNSSSDDEEKSPKLGLEDEEKSPNLGFDESQIRTKESQFGTPHAAVDHLDYFNTDQSTNQTSSADEVGPAETVGSDALKDSDSNSNNKVNSNDTTTTGNGNSKAQPIEDVEIRELIEGWDFPDGKPMTEFGINKILESGMSKDDIETMFSRFPKCNAGFFVKAVGTDKLKPVEPSAPSRDKAACPRRSSDLARFESFIPGTDNPFIRRLLEFGIPMTMYCLRETQNWDIVESLDEDLKKMIRNCKPDSRNMRTIIEKSYKNGDYVGYPKNLIFWEAEYFDRNGRSDLLPSSDDIHQLMEATVSYA